MSVRRRNLRALRQERTRVSAALVCAFHAKLEPATTLDLCQSNLLPAVTTPRSLDLAHLRSALWFHAGEGIDRFVTMDSSQEQAAKEFGLPV